jgi:excisionase family DNA binding protein
LKFGHYEMMERRMEKVLLTVEEAATVMAIGRTKMFELIATGAVESVRIGSSRRVPSAAVEAYVQRLRTEGSGPRTKTAFST